MEKGPRTNYLVRQLLFAIIEKRLNARHRGGGEGAQGPGDPGVGYNRFGML